MRIRALAFGLLLTLATGFSALASPTCTLPFNLQNGQPADATQVMANYNALVTCVGTAASAGANSDITSITGLTTPLSPAQGGSQEFYGSTVAGTANALTITAILPANFALTVGNRVHFRAIAPNTAAATININATGALAIKLRTPQGLVALVGGEIQSGQFYTLEYDGTQYQLLDGPGFQDYGPQFSIASATTTDLGTAHSRNILITGTTTITGFGSSATTVAPLYFLTFNGSLTLTYNATSLILPGAKNITTANGDSAVALYLGTGNWQVLSYTLANGMAVVQPSGASSGFVNLLRNSSESAWFHGTSGTITTAGGWSTEGVYVLPSGASIGFGQISGQIPGYNVVQLQGATGVTDIQVRFVVESLQGATLANYSQATFQITVLQSSGVSVTPTISVKHAGSQDNWGSPVIDVNAASMAALGNNAKQTIAYTFNASSNMLNGVEVVLDFGNNWGASGKNITIYAGFDLRPTPGIAVGINNAPPTPEIRDPASDIAWNQRFYYSTYPNGTAPGAATHNGMAYVYVDGSRLSGGLTFPVPLRAAPTTVNEFDGAGTANKFSTLSAGAYTDGIATYSALDNSANGVHFQVSGSSNGLFLHLTADASIIGG